MGVAVYQEIIAAGVPGPDIGLFAQYAFYFWVLGEAVADQIMEQRFSARQGGGAAAPKDRSPSKSGRSTASGTPVGHSEEGAPIYGDYRLPKELRDTPTTGGSMSREASASWRDLLENWALIELDLLEVYGVDIADPGFARAWPWWRDRIIGLLSTDCRLTRALSPS